MKSIPLSCLFIMLGIFATCNGAEILSPEIQKILSQNDGINSVEYVGESADGKLFFKDLTNTTRTWQDARKFCENFKLEQLAVTTRSQVDFLRQAYLEKKIHFNCWTSAREQRNINMLTWDKTSSKVDLSVFDSILSPPSETSIPFQVCGLAQVHTHNSYLGFQKCTANYHFLCQTP